MQINKQIPVKLVIKNLEDYYVPGPGSEERKQRKHQAVIVEIVLNIMIISQKQA